MFGRKACNWLQKFRSRSLIQIKKMALDPHVLGFD
jgi:hypothetical protein